MFASHRKTFNNFDLVIRDKYETKSKIKLNLSATQNSMNCFINATSRQKLFEVLSIKYSKLYHTKELNDEVDKELVSFLKKEVITETELANLDRKIRSIADTYNNIHRHFDINDSNKKSNGFFLPKVLSKSASYVETRSNRGNRVDTKHSTKMSGASSLSLIFNADEKKKGNVVNTLLEIKRKEAQVKPAQLPFNIEDWNSVMKYNKDQFEEEKMIRKSNQKQIQEFMKKELNKQLAEKHNKHKANILEQKQYDDYVLRNIALKDIEQKKKDEERKNKLREEKNISDKLIEMNKERKNIEKLKEKEFDKEINKPVDYMQEEKENKTEIKRRERQFYQSVEKEDKISKILQNNMRIEEKKRDKKDQEDMKKIFDYMDNERNLERSKSFKIRTFDMNAINKIKQKQMEDQKKEDEMLNKYQKEHYNVKDHEENEKKMDKLKYIQEMKRANKEQINFKNMKKDLEKKIDKEQSIIWHIDSSNYQKQNQELKERMQQEQKKNQQILLKQIQDNKERKLKENEIISEYNEE